MRIAELIQRWAKEGHERTSVRVYTVHLPLRDAARIEALHIMYPGRSESQLMADLGLAVRGALSYWILQAGAQWPAQKTWL